MPVSEHGAAVRDSADMLPRVPRPGAWPEHGHTDPDKALIMTWIGGLIRAGHAEWGMLGNGDISSCAS